MRNCQHQYKTGHPDGMVCQDCGEVFTPDPTVVRHVRQRRKKPLPKTAIRYWYLVPVRLKYHYWSDGEDSFLDTVVDIPITDPFITDLHAATQDRNTTQKKILEESLDALLAAVTRDLHKTLPPELQQDCTITATITGTIRVSDTPLS